MAVQAVDTPSPAMPREARSNLERPGVLRRYPQFTISPAILVALIAAWWLATDVAGVPAYVMPPPDQVLHALIGERSGDTYQLGDRLEVKLVEATPVSGGMRFEVVSDAREGKPVARRSVKTGRPPTKFKGRRR